MKTHPLELGFFSRDSLLRGMAGQGGVWREFLGSENQIFPRQPFPGEENFDFFLANPSPARKFFTFFLAMAGNWLIFVYFGEEFVLLARICMFWRGETCPGEENFDFFPRQPCPGEENFDFFLAIPSPARKI